MKNTLIEFMKGHDIKVPNDWYYACLTEKHIQIFVDNKMAYTFLAEYLAKIDFAMGKSPKDIIDCCKHIAKDYNLNAEKFIKATLKKLFAMIDANLNILK